MEQEIKPIPLDDDLLGQCRAYQIVYDICVAKINELMGIPEERRGKLENPNINIKLLTNGNN